MSSLHANVEDYSHFLGQHRGLRVETIRNHERHLELLITFLSVREIVSFSRLHARLIHDFLEEMGTRYSRKTMASVCSQLRGFLRFLFRKSITSRDLSPNVVSPRIYRHETCPRFLTQSQVVQVLQQVDRRTPIGRRDFAMMLLLAMYGLRGKEVVHLRLDAIDWRRNELHIRNRKAGNSTRYPLAAQVGEAIADYLQNGRPVSTERWAFLSSTPPHSPFKTSAVLSHRCCWYISKARIVVEKPGTHVFRYSCAQRLFDHGLSLKAVGDFLGHTHPDSTLRYTKIAFEQLREVALGDGEDVL